jgi:D-glycero-D-manno-heptose 1,7-bisphosphate phosphatase
MDRAVFLDRDGTLVLPRHYPSQPEELILFDSIGPELCALQDAGFRLVVITNQSGLALGYFTEDDLSRMHDHIAAELARLGVHLDDIYHCPHHPDGVVAALAVVCTCRKPQPGLLLQAAAELQLDLRRSWFLGDILDDVEAGTRAGCRTVLVDVGTEALPSHQIRQPDFVARDTVHALRIVQAVEQVGPPTELHYLPPSWQPVERMQSAGAHLQQRAIARRVG